MIPLEIEGYTLGEKHKQYNEILKEVNYNDIKTKEITLDGNDIDNLLKIDVACKNREVDYVLEVLKCEDLLYVSRALKHCAWLVTERQYAHIINPEHLHEQLFPHMTAKASRKLLLHVRLHLRDEPRVEQFYNYFSDRDLQTAFKWLQHCSVPFIENVVHNQHHKIPMRLFKRLCEKSISILETFVKSYKWHKSEALQVTMFLIKTHTDKYLDIVESVENYEYPNFGKNPTDIIMKKCSQRIISNFPKYANNIHLQSFTKHLKNEDVKSFLLKYITDDNLRCWFRYNTVKHFIKIMPAETRFAFVKEVFIDRIVNKDTNDTLPEDSKEYKMKMLYSTTTQCDPRLTKVYHWYKFAPFNVAFTELKKLINNESSPYEKYSMLTVLLTCADRNMGDIQILLQYYRNQHIKDQLEFKERFINKVIEQNFIYEFDDHTWNLLDEVFKSMQVYTESENNVDTCIKAIIIYKVLHDQEIPDIIEKKFKFDTFKSYETKLKSEYKNKIFGYLYEHILTKMQEKENITNKTEFDEAIKLLQEALRLLKDWKKAILAYPYFFDKIREFIQIKKTNSWNTNLSSLYTLNKCWRRAMFEVSLSLYASEATCLNALKHGPSELARHGSEVEALRCADDVSLGRLLARLRIYWPQSLANEWERAYRDRLSQADGRRALARGLCVLLPRRPLLELLHQFAPKQPRIDWSQPDELALSLQKHLAKSMHLARPHPPPDALLQYAVGDYLQYAMPSLNAIFYNISPIQSREHILKLLEAPVSLQKHGIRFAFIKLETNDVKQIFFDTWKSTKNITIRAILFKHAYDLLCREKNPDKILYLWKLVDMFIENLSFKEDKKLYDLLSKIEEVPLSVRSNYLEKSYKFLKLLLPESNKDAHDDHERAINSLVNYTKEIMEFMDTNFMTDLLLEFIESKYTAKNKSENNMIDIISSFVLCSKDEESQMKKYETILKPLFKRSFALWEEIDNGEYYIRHKVHKLLTRLRGDLESYVINKDMINPITIFTLIENELEQLSVQKNYLMLTMWKLTMAFVKILEKYKYTVCEEIGISDENEGENKSKWNEIWLKAEAEYGKLCLQYLKEDVEKYFPNIYVLYTRALNDTLSSLVADSVQWKIYECLLQDKDFIQAYLATIKLLPEYCDDETKPKMKQLHEIIKTHPSVEVKIHYYYKYKCNEDDESIDEF